MFEERNWEAQFTKRLETHYEEMKWLYQELYGDEHAFDYFITMLHHYYSERRQVLREWDEAREVVTDAEPGRQKRRRLRRFGFPEGAAGAGDDAGSCGSCG